MPDQMWAPWRRAFVEGAETEQVIPPGPTGCIFCDYPRPHGAPARDDDAEFDRLRLVVHLREHAFVILNKYPYSNGHVMVVPRVHTARIDQLPETQFSALHALLKDTITAVHDAYQPHGMNVGMNVGKAAGAGIAEHAHYHIVPRWNGDVNFMPVLADTKVISEGLQDTYARLKKQLG